jgi:hypothetical protein
MVDGQFRMDHVATVYAPEVGFFLNNSDLLVIGTTICHARIFDFNPTQLDRHC